MRITYENDGLESLLTVQLAPTEGVVSPAGTQRLNEEGLALGHFTRETSRVVYVRLRVGVCYPECVQELVRVMRTVAPGVQPPEGTEFGEVDYLA